jgi:hypothetical protein
MKRALCDAELTSQASVELVLAFDNEVENSFWGICQIGNPPTSSTTHSQVD